MATGYLANAENGSDIHSSLECQDQSLPFSTIVRTTVLPVVVKYDSSCPVDERLVTPAFNPNEPIVVHSKHRVRRFKARCVKFQWKTKTIIDCDCDAVIPEAYPGWFAVFGNPSVQARDPVVPHFRRISQLAISSCRRFLVAGDRPMKAFLVRQGEGEQIDFHPVGIHPGTMLTKGKLFSMSPQPVKGKKKLRKKEKGKVPEDNYLSAKDDHGYTFFVPCEMEGFFYVVELETAHLQTPVLRLADIVERYRFPLLITLVQGPVPPSPSFNGTFVLFASEFTSFAITYSINLHKEMIFEILEDSSLPFLFSAPEENESKEYESALSYHRSHEDFFLDNIRFQNRTSDHTFVKDYMASLDSKSSSRGLDITCVRIEKIPLFPPSPANMKVVNPEKVPNSILSLNVKEIKRSLTFERPRGIKSDIIPIENKRESRTQPASTDEGRLECDTNSSALRPQSGSDCSTLSSASRPSSQDTVMSESEGKEEELPPPPPELLLDNSVLWEDEDVPEDVPDESKTYYGIWTSNTLSKDSKFSTEVEGRNGLIIRQKADTNNEDKNGHTANQSDINVLEDENGYVIASELTVQFNKDKNRRPASYLSIHPLENTYETLTVNDSDNIHTGENEKPSNSDEAQNQIQPRDTVLGSRSHHYTSFIDMGPAELDKPNPQYMNTSFPRTRLYGERCYENIPNSSKSFDGHRAPATQIEQGHSAILKELASHSLKKGLQSTFGSNASTAESGGYMNLQGISPNFAASQKDRLIQTLNQQDLKKKAVEAVEALNEDDVDSLIESDDQIHRLKELVPHISISDIFQIGLCLKDF